MRNLRSLHSIIIIPLALHNDDSVEVTEHVLEITIDDNYTAEAYKVNKTLYQPFNNKTFKK